MTYHQKPVIYVGNVTLNVRNLKRSIDFYQNVIGFKVLKEEEKRAKLTADGTTVLLTIEQPEEVLPKQPRTTGLYHFALLLPNRYELSKKLRHFIQLRCPLQGASDHLVSEALYLADPDGNGIEIYADRPSSAWEWVNNEVSMTTVPLDVESLLAEGEGAEWVGLPVGTVMGHIHLHVSDLDQANVFYTQGLGLDVVAHYGSQALFVSSGRYHHHIGLNTWNGVGVPAPPANSVGLVFYTLIFPSEVKRMEAANQLKQIGAAVKEENGVTMTTDPSGNRIHLLVKE